MKVAIIYNKDFEGVINRFGVLNKEVYNPATIQRVFKALEAGGHNVSVIDGNKHVVEQLEEFMPRVMEGERMGMVFNMAYGIQGESRYTHIPALLEMLGIPYVGSSPSGHALALDKVYTKIIMQKLGIPTPDFWVFNNADEDLNQVEYPAIVKPKMESVSFGLNVVYNRTELIEAIGIIHKEFKQQVLVERFIPGREFCVGLLGNNPVETFPVLEIDLGNDPKAIQTYEDKMHTPRGKICPANISDELSAKMTSLSTQAFKSLGLRDFSRVDIRLGEGGKIYLLEINSMASLGSNGSYVNAAAVAGYNYTDLVNKMLDVAAVRYFIPDISPETESKSGNTKKLNIRMRSYLNSRQEFLEKLLKDLVNMNSYVRNTDGVNKLGGLIAKQLANLGFNSFTIAQAETGNTTFYKNTDDEDLNILFLGHLDNSVTISGHQYFRKTDQKLSGTGIWEHKSGIVMLIGALQALKFTRNLKKLKVGILLTTDNALQGRISKEHILSYSKKAKVVMGLHGSSPAGGIVVSRSGAAVYHCQMNLRGAEDSRLVPEAASVFTRFITRWTELTDKDRGIIISPSDLKVVTNITMPYAHGEATVSVRFNSMDAFNEMDMKVQKLLPKIKKSFIDIQISGGLRRPSLIPNNETEEYVRVFQNIARKMDIRCIKEHRWSSADICFVESETACIDGFGPIGTKDTIGREYILRHSVIDKSVFLSSVILEVLKRSANVSQK